MFALVCIDFVKVGPDFACVLTQKSWAVSGSPQSTLSAVGSWSVSPSPPATPLGGNDGWDLMYAAAAAGQLARLKMNAEGLSPTQILTPIQHPSYPVGNPNTGFYANQSNSHTLSHANHVSLSVPFS